MKSGVQKEINPAQNIKALDARYQSQEARVSPGCYGHHTIYNLKRQMLFYHAGYMSM